ncbi:hypothetical protein PROFUN_00665 [Planoprotostelium fungivorum]|uniref:Uncharacterized protein n=1 Tax=Planoprotostelium fungivorum TaxID=1890364 RepID=A0A2P6NU15_9EUKA|nr:hypothetical protein PROFUN_00665 [Planoprotostelium fungivorum]
MYSCIVEDQLKTSVIIGPVSEPTIDNTGLIQTNAQAWMEETVRNTKTNLLEATWGVASLKLLSSFDNRQTLHGWVNDVWENQEGTVLVEHPSDPRKSGILRCQSLGKEGQGAAVLLKTIKKNKEARIVGKDEQRTCSTLEEALERHGPVRVSALILADKEVLILKNINSRAWVMFEFSLKEPRVHKLVSFLPEMSKRELVVLNAIMEHKDVNQKVGLISGQQADDEYDEYAPANPDSAFPLPITPPREVRPTMAQRPTLALALPPSPVTVAPHEMRAFTLDALKDVEEKRQQDMVAMFGLSAVDCSL